MSENAHCPPLRSGLFFLDPARRSAIEHTARHAHCQVFAVDLAGQAKTGECLARLGRALRFPDWYGANFDALYDCLSDPEWEPAPGHLLLFAGLNVWKGADPDGFATLLEVLQAVVDARAGDVGPFCILIDAPAGGLPSYSPV